MNSVNNLAPSIQIGKGVESQFVASLTRIVLNRFGTMTKNDYEVLFFHLLTEYGNLKEQNTFAIANILKMPETKVKRLAYEANLVYGNYDRNRIIFNFLQLLSNSIPVVEGETIKFAVQDKYLRSAVQSELLSLGHFGDGSFNSDIISINKKAFTKLLEAFYVGRGEKEKIEKMCSETAEKNFSWTEVAQHLMNSTADELPKIVAKLIMPAGHLDIIVETLNKLV